MLGPVPPVRRVVRPTDQTPDVFPNNPGRRLIAGEIDQRHEWLEVKNRRWCLTCRAFQQRIGEAHAWLPLAARACPRDTPYASWKQEEFGEASNGAR